MGRLELFFSCLLMVVSLAYCINIKGTFPAIIQPEENQETNSSILCKLRKHIFPVSEYVSRLPGKIYKAATAIRDIPRLLLGSGRYINFGNIISGWPYVKREYTEYRVQSPTNIITKNAIPIWLSRISFRRCSTLGKQTVSIINTGYYLEMLLKPGHNINMPSITGGPLLKDVYVFEQGHFHWGLNDDCGSEHRINNKCYSTEFHWVFSKKNYGGFNKAKKHPDGITVVGAFGKLSEEDNPDLIDLIGKLHEIIEPESETTGSFEEEFKFIDVIFKQEEYLSFPGSLTTPEFEECVTWIIFTEPFLISRRQLDAFRQLRNKDGTNMIRENDRPLQEFGIRPLVHPWIKKKVNIQTEEDKNDPVSTSSST